MSNERETQREVRRIVRMLEATTKLIEKPTVSEFDNFANGENVVSGSLTVHSLVSMI